MKKAYIIAELAALCLVEYALVNLPWQITDQLQIIPAALTCLMVLYLIITGQVDFSGKGMIPMVMGLFFIGVGDLFLCFLLGRGMTEGELLGYIGFTVCQLFFAWRLGIGKNNLFARFSALLIMEGILTAVGMFSFANFWGIFNLSQLLVNVITSWMLFRREHKNWQKFMAIGLTCFAGCDYSLLLFTLLPQGWLFTRGVGMFVWICYVPAQIFLVASLSASCQMKKGLVK